ncbi:hypothetical protein M9H77_34199 [Catharanthus roseus]|uniref:Uncharacterized protein n=1 Tax=Catharanthus roseus TaxID=4058 RepID=A0ACB9ZM78_CATRO|nr:hypothetical protein M9H77_34199 [Catharanthus roseus]
MKALCLSKGGQDINCKSASCARVSIENPDVTRAKGDRKFDGNGRKKHAKYAMCCCRGKDSHNKRTYKRAGKQQASPEADIYRSNTIGVDFELSLNCTQGQRHGQSEGQGLGHDLNDYNLSQINSYNTFFDVNRTQGYNPSDYNVTQMNSYNMSFDVNPTQEDVLDTGRRVQTVITHVTFFETQIHIYPFWQRLAE